MASASQDKLPAATTLDPAKLTASCHCGRVTLELPSRPTKVNDCRCSICYRYGVMWAYYPRSEVLVLAADPGTHGYVREDEGGDGDIGFYACAHCNCLTHWWRHGAASAEVKMGINTRMLPESMLEGVERTISYGPVLKGGT